MLKIEGEIGNTIMYNNIVRLSFSFPFSEIANSTASVMYIGKTFDLFVVHEKIKYKFANAILYRLVIEHDGDSKLIVEIEPKDMDISFSELQDLRDTTVIVALKPIELR